MGPSFKGLIVWLETPEECLKIKQDKTKIKQPNNQLNQQSAPLLAPNSHHHTIPSLPYPCDVSMFISLLIFFLLHEYLFLLLGSSACEFLEVEIIHAESPVNVVRSVCFLGAGNIACRSQPSNECFAKSFPNTTFHL